VNAVGEPYEGNPQVRFDEGPVETQFGWAPPVYSTGVQGAAGVEDAAAGGACDGLLVGAGLAEAGVAGGCGGRLDGIEQPITSDVGMAICAFEFCMIMHLYVRDEVYSRR